MEKIKQLLAIVISAETVSNIEDIICEIFYAGLRVPNLVIQYIRQLIDYLSGGTNNENNPSANNYFPRFHDSSTSLESEIETTDTRKNVDVLFRQKFKMEQMSGNASFNDALTVPGTVNTFNETIRKIINKNENKTTPTETTTENGENSSNWSSLESPTSSKAKEFAEAYKNYVDLAEGSSKIKDSKTRETNNQSNTKKAAATKDKSQPDTKNTNKESEETPPRKTREDPTTNRWTDHKKQPENSQADSSPFNYAFKPHKKRSMVQKIEESTPKSIITEKARQRTLRPKRQNDNLFKPQTRILNKSKALAKKSVNNEIKRE